MNILSLRDFYDVYKSISPKEIIFSSENQSSFFDNYTAMTKMVFSTMSVMYSPCSVHFSGDKCYLNLCSIKYVRVDDLNSPLGAVFTIVSGNIMSKSDVLYTIIMR